MTRTADQYTNGEFARLVGQTITIESGPTVLDADPEATVSFTGKVQYVDVRRDAVAFGFEGLGNDEFVLNREDLWDEFITEGV